MLKIFPRGESDESDDRIDDRIDVDWSTMPSPARSGSHSRPSPGSADSSDSASTSHPSLTFRQYKAEVRRVMAETAGELNKQRNEAMAKDAGSLAGEIQRRLILVSSWVHAQTRTGRDRTYRDGGEVGTANGFLSENLALVGNLFLHVPFEQNLNGLMPTRYDLLEGVVERWENVDTRAADAFYRTLHVLSADLLQFLAAQKSAADNAGSDVVVAAPELFKSRRILVDTQDGVVERVMAEVGVIIQRVKQEPIRHVLNLPDLDGLLRYCSPSPSASQSSPFSIQSRH
ncbi:hypothetical protein JCM10296v2_002235 [Rhodotorula toruloides]